MRNARSLAACFVVGALAACKVGPNFTMPHPTVPEEYAGVKDAADGGPAPVPSAVSPPASFWWRQFHDPELDRLEERAVAGNLDLQAAFLRIVEARIQVQSSRAQGLPGLNASASYAREQLGLAGILKSQHINGTAASPATDALISALETPVNVYQLGFDASWELDLFGRVRRSVEEADARSAGAVESRNDLLVSLEAEVAQDYFQLRAGQMLRRTIFGDINLQSPRWYRCACEERFTHVTYSALNTILTTHTAPELEFLLAKWSAHLSFAAVVDLLHDVLPVDPCLQVETVRRHVFATAERLEAELGPEQFTYDAGCQLEIEASPEPGPPITVGLNAEEGAAKVFAGVRRVDTKPKRRLHEVLSSSHAALHQKSFPNAFRVFIDARTLGYGHL
jgi:hypothetical protein